MPVVICPKARSRKSYSYRPANPNLLNRTEAAAYIGVSPGSLAHWSRSCRGPRPRRIGRSTYYLISDLDAWMDTRVVPGRI